jgi:hypothetical protein
MAYGVRLVGVGGALGALGLSAILSLGLGACSSGSSATGPTCNPCDPGSSGGTSSGGTQTNGHDANPDGVPYPAPASGYGRTARSGSAPGSVIQNFKFLGFLNGDNTQPLTTISLADYYDPCNKRYKLLHLTVAAVWCQPCNQETNALVAAKSSLAQQQVVVIQALDDGPTVGVPATMNDLNYWIKNHSSNFTEMMDPGLKNLGGFFDAAAIPWNADIDPRTMEILDSSDGWAGDVQTEIQPGLDSVSTAALYPVAACN